MAKKKRIVSKKVDKVLKKIFDYKPNFKKKKKDGKKSK